MTTLAGTGPAATSDRGAIKFAAIAVGFVMAALDATVVNVAGASIKDRLGLGLDHLTWVVDGYMLTFASLLLLAGALGARFGAKRVYLIGMALFVVSSVACGLAPNGDVLVAARVVQGVASALFLPGSLVLLVGAFPEPARRARIVALWSAAGAGASGLGPVVGGVLVDSFGWRSIFMINVPIGLVGFVLTAKLIKPVDEDTTRRVKPLGHLFGVVALAGLAYALIEGPDQGWGSPGIVAAIAVAVVFATAFVVRERRGDDPILPVELFRAKAFSIPNAVGVLLNFGLYGVLFMIGLFLQQVHGATPLRAGLQMLPMMIVFVVGNLVVARFVPKIGTRLPMIVGLSVAGVVSVLMAAVSPATPYWVLALAMSVANLGLGITAPAMTAALVEAAGPAHASVASATFNAGRQVGTLLGVAVAGTVLASFADWYGGARTTFLVAAAAYLVAVALVLRHIRRTPQ
ncbi:MFS transporter [Saccharothrix violaceirubra]|uniref:DHA2 family methylenomycin A resistance protein-like MFS transporter n=1 Tax=Saccharothrix violaceirubra TaxID=413306 RepID=A0A7W7WVL7_9PSEU|nr:MFS transporter [Saccharothrix violaceirubra]MBB4965464.1 DHA2 family methylenomycin A resistance protein-like MFS transporter [Saccharothrix violaceirubra]